jgi:cation:H+ antiporter
MPWLIFFVTSAIVVFAAIKLAEYGDIISVRTGLGGLVVGTIFLAGATSLPELLAAISSFAAGEPNLAAGNFFGSNMVNIVLLAIIDGIHYQVPLLRRAAVSHALTASLAMIMMLIAVLAIMLRLDIGVGWFGFDSVALIAVYFVGMRLIQKQMSGEVQSAEKMTPAIGFPTLRRGIIGFAIASLVLIVVVPFLVSSATDIAEITGLGTTFVGTALLSVVTSLPELVAAYGAVRIGAYDLAVGNLFGSSVFNMFGLALSDAFYTDGFLLSVIDESFALVGLFALLMTGVALFANLSRVERKIGFIELDAFVIIAIYLLAMLLLYTRGIG